MELAREAGAKSGFVRVWVGRGAATLPLELGQSRVGAGAPRYKLLVLGVWNLRIRRFSGKMDQSPRGTRFISLRKTSVIIIWKV